MLDHPGLRALARDRPITELGSDGDHQVVALGDDLVVKIRRGVEDEVERLVSREIRVLELVGPISPIPVPEVVVADPSAGLIVLTRLEGTSLLDEPCPEAGRLTGQLADLLAGLASVPERAVVTEVGADSVPLDLYLAEAAAHLAHVQHLLSAAGRELVEAWLAAPRPPEPTRTSLCHNDLGAEHLLAGHDRCRLTGVIDWSDAAASDPARDLARIHRDLGPRIASEVLRRVAALQDTGTWERAQFLARCALLEDLAYGHETGRAPYRDAALQSLWRTFAS
jgi:aminoglycoside phosphotransferase (APT) family kinase protein